ncbi:hypothetical protein GCM10023091_14800 [Ravibacter arvi]|uniref:NADPH-dependent FMN reductase-like domain-containing protein n=1 Tax=Ravibacter arvi TaxID=2051041 RepID=A0ABP8LVP1_9BACT
MKIAVICTSPRKGSNSLKVAKFLSGIAADVDGNEVSLVDFEDADIPLVGRGDLDPSNLTVFQQRLITTWAQAELVVFVVPEYNWMTGGELINAYHQLGSRHFHTLFNDRVFAFAGVSNGKGGRLPCIEMSTMLGKIINVLNGDSVISPKIFESQYTQDVLDENGVSKGDASYERAAAGFLSYAQAAAARWQRGK